MKYALRMVGLLLASLAFASQAGSQPVDVRGAYVLVIDPVFTSSAGLAAQSALKLPGVDGMTFVTTWSTIEPGHGIYDWRSFDKWMHFADSLGRKITVVIKAGSGIPSWVFQPPPSGSGAVPLNFRVSPHEGKTNVCDTETIAAPWDANYLAAWDTLLGAASSHLKSTGAYSAVTALRITGINRTSDELRLPAETAQSTGLACVSDAIATWEAAGYRPSKLLAAWDAVTSSFLKSFPDKAFSIAIIPNPPQLPFPPIAEDGTEMTGSIPDQNIPLLQLAARKFPARLIVQFNFLLNGTQANASVIQAAQTLGTMIAYQTNNFYSLTDSGAACGGTPANPSPCSSAQYMAQLETGIYPLGQSFSLRSQYIELWPINANAFPSDMVNAHVQLLATPLPSNVTIDLGTPQQLFHAGKADAMGMAAVPDMHTAILQEPDSSYRVWIAGRFSGDSIEGATGLLKTRDFLTYSPGGTADTVPVVLAPSCRPGSIACWSSYDADYAGADLVFPASNHSDLLMLYHGQTKYYGVRPPDRQIDPSWCVVGLARSSDNGMTWTREGAVVSGADPKPDTIPKGGIFGAVEPGAIVAGGYIYTFYSYFPTHGAADDGPPTIQVARAPVAGDGAAGSWTKFDSIGFGVQPGLGGIGSQVVPTVFNDTRPAQPWPVYSSYLNSYVLIFICGGGWYFSTSTDLVTWAMPQRFYTAPDTEFTNGEQTDENVVLVTPGNPSQVIGQTGYVLYAHTPSWGTVPHMLYMRPFTFNAQTTSAPIVRQSEPSGITLLQNYPNPFNPTTVIRGQWSVTSVVRLAVYDILGREVAVLADGRYPAGKHSFSFDGSRLASGIYFYRLTAGQYTATRAMALVK